MILLKSRWVIERTELLQSLRNYCAEYGDTDFSDKLHLVDIFEEHLIRHLVEGES